MAAHAYAVEARWLCFLLAVFFIRTLFSEVTARNLTELLHMFESGPHLKKRRLKFAESIP